MGGFGSALGCVGLGGLRLELGGEAIDESVAVGGGGAYDALVVDPSGRGVADFFRELGLGVLVLPVLGVGVGEDANPAVGDLVGDDLMAGSDEGDALRLIVGCDVDVGRMDERGACRAVVAGLVLWRRAARGLLQRGAATV